MWDCCFQLRALLGRRGQSDCDVSKKVSELVGSVSVEETVESICLSISVSPSCPPPSPLSPERGSEAGGVVPRPPQGPITFSLQQNSSLPKRYSGTNIKFIHSFNKYELSISDEPCLGLGAEDITVGGRQKSLPSRASILVGLSMSHSNHTQMKKTEASRGKLT